ncbi:MAG: hypothetical protein ACFBRM_01170 [Pikeienuella sp.]
MHLLCIDFGNICRGPLAEVVFRQKLGAAGLPAKVESAGISIIEPGVPPDPRAVQVARAKGYRLDDKRCRPLSGIEIAQFDVWLAVDRYVQDHLRTWPLPTNGRRVRLLHPEGIEILDPHDGTMEDFERALDLIEEAAEVFAARLRS